MSRRTDRTSRPASRATTRLAPQAAPASRSGSRRTPARVASRVTARLLAVSLAVLAPAVALTAVAPAPGAQAIVGGSQVPDGRLRFMASLQTKAGDHFCGGSIVAKRWILTAAHCSDRAPASAQVVVGRTDLEQSRGQVLPVTRIVVHPSWEETGTHDVALWRVGRDIRAPRIPLVALDQQRFERSGAELTVAGWGTEVFGSPTIPTRMKQVDVEAVADDACVTNQVMGFQAPTEICAEALGGDSCQGDSGGPLFARDAAGRPVQVGVVSYGLGCATPGFPGVYAEVNNPSIHRFLTRALAG